MRKLTIGLGVAAVVVIGAQGLLGQSDDTPFRIRGDRGELVHVLPPPALVHNKSDRNAVFAPPSNDTAVFSPSYGSGNLMNHGGVEIGAAEFQAIYWNGDTELTSVSSQVNAFVATFGSETSSEYSQAPTDDFSIVQQYGTPTTITAAFSVLSPPFTDTTVTTAHPTAPSTFSDTQIQQYLTSLFTPGRLTPSANVVYGIYFPNGTTVTLSNSASCTSFCGYHNVYPYTNVATGNTTQIKYAVFPYPSCGGCSIAGLGPGDMLTIVSSHEIREAVTDPGDNGLYAWYDRTGYEADDKCAWHNLYKMTNGAFWVQPEFSNGGTVTRSGFTATYPGPGCVVPNSSGPPPKKHGK